jgi:hypothetical protein
MRHNSRRRLDVGTAEDAHPPTERMMAMLATFAYVRVLILWSYWLFSKVAKVANIPTGVKVAIFEFKHGHHAKVPTKMALVMVDCAARMKTFVMCRGARIKNGNIDGGRAVVQKTACTPGLTRVA